MELEKEFILCRPFLNYCHKCALNEFYILIPELVQQICIYRGQMYIYGLIVTLISSRFHRINPITSKIHTKLLLDLPR